MEVTTFTCTICGEGSRDICIACTKDTCGNHLCERCKRCSDCCVCEVRLVEHHERNGKGFVHAPAEPLPFEHAEHTSNAEERAGADEEDDPLTAARDQESA